MKISSTCLAAAAVVALAGTALSGCNDPAQAHRDHAHLSRGPQPVAAPGPHDLSLSKRVKADPVASPKRPNIMMITLDDATYSDFTKMPNLQRLVADQGVTLDNALAPTPLCVPARASLLSGQYANNHGAQGIHGPHGGVTSFKNDKSTVATWLQQAGYRTMFVGKYLNGYGEDDSPTYVPPGWDDWQATTDPSTYSFTKPVFNENGHLHRYHRYISGLDRDKSISAINSAEKAKKPWFLWTNYVAPHVGGPGTSDDPAHTHPGDPHPVRVTTPAKRDVGTFKHLQLPTKPNMFENTNDKLIIRATHRTWSEQRRDELRQADENRVEAVQSADRAIRATIDKLKHDGQLKNTYVVVTSDNGYFLGEHNLTGKLWYFREAQRVPMIISGPGLPHGTRSPVPVTNADWAPTFASLAGARPTRPQDGTNVLPYLKTRADKRIVPIIGYPVKSKKKSDKPLYTGVTVGPWTYVEGKHGKTELYNRAVDPYETSNLARDPRYTRYRDRLAKLTEKYATCQGSECPKRFYR